MTVSYTNEVVTATKFSMFLKLLARWQGSIYKLIWKDLLMFLLYYYTITVIYVFALHGTSKENFEAFCNYCKQYYSFIPVSFVLGFYVNIVMDRWWLQYRALPFPDNLAILVSAHLPSQEEKGRILRRTIMRQVCLSFAMTMNMMCPKVKKRFPTLQHYVDAGLMLEEEKTIYERFQGKYKGYSKYWMPLTWASNLVTKSRHQGLITSDTAMGNILNELQLFRTNCGLVLDYDWISIPLVYTQVVTLAVYSYFFISGFAQQFLQTETILFPFLTILEFFFYVGWLKVAETLINPFGDDDDDFEINWMLDRHFQMSMLIVDQLHHNVPTPAKDIYFDLCTPDHLPYTLASKYSMEERPVESTSALRIDGTDAKIVDENAMDTSWNFLRRRKRKHLKENTDNSNNVNAVVCKY